MISGQLPMTAHTSRPWRVHAVAGDFEIQDVWILDTPGSRDDFSSLVQLIGSLDFPSRSSRLVRLVWSVR